MPGKIWNSLLASIFIASVAASVNCAAATPTQIDAARNRGLAWLYSHQQGMGGWESPVGAEAITGQVVLDGFNKAGVKGFSYYSALSWLVNLKVDSVDSISRQLLAQAAAGGNARPFFLRLYQLRTATNTATWGPYQNFYPSFADTALAMEAIRTGQFTSASDYPNYVNELRQNIFCRILPYQNTDGGWGYARQANEAMPNAKSSILPTVLMVLELNAGKAATGESGSCSSTYSINSATVRALDWLLTLKKPDNGFGEGPTSSVFETALVYEALSALRPADTANDLAMDYLLSRQNGAAVGAGSYGGSWNASAMQTGYILKIMPPPESALTDTDNDGIPDAVETLLGTNSLVADNRWQASDNNSDALSPLDIYPSLHAEVFTNNVSNLTLTAKGGKLPYTWAVAAGSLPPGLSLDSTTGVISGTPIALGSFNFVYSVKDASGNAAAHADGIIKVSPGKLPGDINGDGVIDASDKKLVATIMQALQLLLLD